MRKTYHTVDNAVLRTLQVGTTSAGSTGVCGRPSLDGWNDLVSAVSRCRVIERAVERVDISVERLGVGHAGVDGSLFRHDDI